MINHRLILPCGAILPNRIAKAAMSEVKLDLPPIVFAREKRRCGFIAADFGGTRKILGFRRSCVQHSEEKVIKRPFFVSKIKNNGDWRQ